MRLKWPKRKPKKSLTLEQARARQDKADHVMRVYTAVVVTVVSVLLLGTTVFSIFQREATKNQIIDCVTANTACNKQLQDAQAENTASQIQSLIDSISDNVHNDELVTQSQLKRLIAKVDELLAGR